MSRRRFRFVRMTIHLDTAASPPIHEARCRTCRESSGESRIAEQPELWCLKHAGRTHHFGFESVLTKTLVVEPQENIR